MAGFIKINTAKPMGAEIINLRDSVNQLSGNFNTFASRVNAIIAAYGSVPAAIAPLAEQTGVAPEDVPALLALLSTFANVELVAPLAVLVRA